MINVAIIDTQKFDRMKIKESLESENIKIVSEGTSSEEMLNLYENKITDVIISEIDSNKDTTFYSVTRLLMKRPNASIIIWTENEDTECAKELIRIGVKGYLFKTRGKKNLKEAVMNVKNGQSFIEEEIVHEMMQDVRRLSELEKTTAPKPIKWPSDLITKREWEVLNQLAAGYSNEVISNNLYLSDRTVKNHVSSILKKLKVEHRTQAVVKAIKNNWVQI